MSLVETLKAIDKKVDYKRANVCTDAGKCGNTCPDCLSNRYYTGAPIDYSCDQLRHIYALRYLPVHVQENLDILESISKDHLSNTWPSPIMVLALGGGPGSEIVALQKFVADNGFFGATAPSIEVTRVDRVDEWKSIYVKVREVSQGDSVKYDYRKINGDVCDITEYKGSYDLVFLSYIVSELTDMQAQKLADALKSVINRHVVLAFNDRNEGAVVNRIDLIASNFNVCWEYVSTEKRHVGMSYPDDIKDRVQPKLNLSSYRRGLVINQ